MELCGISRNLCQVDTNECVHSELVLCMLILSHVIVNLDFSLLVLVVQEKGEYC